MTQLRSIFHWKVSAFINKAFNNLSSFDSNWITSKISSIEKYRFVRKHTGVYFINVLRAPFLYVSLFGSFSLVTFGFVIFGAKILYEKHAPKTLMKLTPIGLNSKLRSSESSFSKALSVVCKKNVLLLLSKAL